MTDENEGANIDESKETKEKTPVDREMDRVYSENRLLKEEIEKVKEMLKEKDVDLTRMNSFLDNQTKGKFLAEAQGVSNYPLEYLTQLTTDELKQMIEDYKHMRPIRFASSGKLSGDVDPYTTLHNMFDEADKARRARWEKR